MELEDNPQDVDQNNIVCFVNCEEKQGEDQLEEQEHVYEVETYLKHPVSSLPQVVDPLKRCQHNLCLLTY